jgi:hypothetical protein
MVKKTQMIALDIENKKILDEIKLCKSETYESVIVRLLKMHPDFPKFKDRLK